jgi:acyl dehydratase
MAMRLAVDNMIVKTASEGATGVEECRWIKPVRQGDELRLEMEVITVRPSASRPKIGFVKFDWRVFNRQEQVASIVTNAMMKRRG